VQGQLRGEPLTVQVSTQCAHCGQPLHLEIDSKLNYRVMEEGAEPLVFVPMVDLGELDAPSIIDVF
jgi:hypothetical protein